MKLVLPILVSMQPYFLSNLYMSFSLKYSCIIQVCLCLQGILSEVFSIVLQSSLGKFFKHTHTSVHIALDHMSLHIQFLFFFFVKKQLGGA